MSDVVERAITIMVPGGNRVSIRAGLGAPAHGGATGDQYLRADGSGQTYRKETGSSVQTGWIDQSVSGEDYKMPANGIADTLDRSLINAQVAPTTATIFMSAIFLRAGTVVSNLNLQTGTTALATGTNEWMALYDANRVQVASTADQALASMAASTPFAWPIATTAAGAATSYTVPTTGLYYQGVMLKATTVCTLLGYTRIASGAPIIQGSANAAQAAVNAFPFTASALTETTTYHYLWVS